MPEFPLPRPITHVIFDFDGTLSWLRHGWPHIMMTVMRGHLPSQPSDSDESVKKLLMDLIISLNGHATIKQMERFASLVSERGGPVLDPEQLRQQFQQQLDAEISARTHLVRSGQVPTDDFVVYAARPLLTWLIERGIKLSVVSSTVEHRVREEAALLGLTDFFEDRIHGCQGDPTQFNKRDVFNRIMTEQQLAGENLLAFGDGPVELAVTTELGGLAIAVCSDEDHNGSGIMDTIKETQLLAAGAFIAIPDYRAAQQLVQSLLLPS